MILKKCKFIELILSRGYSIFQNKSSLSSSYIFLLSCIHQTLTNNSFTLLEEFFFSFRSIWNISKDFLSLQMDFTYPTIAQNFRKNSTLKTVWKKNLKSKARFRSSNILWKNPRRRIKGGESPGKIAPLKSIAARVVSLGSRKATSSSSLPPCRRRIRM